MMQAPSVSVVVPCFNYGRFLGEALESVRVQTLREWECIVVDDGSTDDTAEIASSFAKLDTRFCCIRQEQRGPSGARNAGLRKARAPFIQFLDADDLLEADKLLRHSRFLAEHPEFSMVYGSMRYFTSGGTGQVQSRGRNRTQRDWMTMWPDTTEGFLLALVKGNTFPISAPLFRKAALDEVGYFDESLPSHEDWEFWLRFAFAGKRFQGLDAPGTRTLVREHAESLSRRTVLMAETRLEVRRRIEKVTRSEPLKATNRVQANYDECELGAAYMACGRWREGLRRFRKGLAGADHKSIAVRALLVHLAPRWMLGLWRRGRDRAFGRQGI
jgi:glycosyltransferase involved in cell wall biosynthesis